MTETKKIESITKNISFIGECLCDGLLVTYLASKPKNRFNVYCMDCGSVSDIRSPKSGDTYNTQDNESPLGLLCRIYQTVKGIYITDDQISKTKVSEEVNNLHGTV